MDIRTKCQADPIPMRDRRNVDRCTRSCAVGLKHGLPQLTMRLANTIELRRMAWSYIYRHYRNSSLARRKADGYWYGPHDLQPTTHTFLVENQSRIQGTVSVFVDSVVADDGKHRLPADTLFPQELKKLRESGKTLAEVASLVSKPDEGLRNTDVLKALMLLAAHSAFNSLDCDCLVITVHPHHAAFYERVLAFQRHSPVRQYEKVNGAPAVLLELSFDRAMEARQGLRGKRAQKMWQFILDPQAEAKVRSHIQRYHRPLPQQAVALFSNMQDGNSGDLASCS